MLSRTVFDEKKCSKGIQHLENYRKIWDDKLSCYKNSPFHDEHSHAADAFRYLATGLKYIEAGKGSIENDYAALRKYWGN